MVNTAEHLHFLSTFLEKRSISPPISPLKIAPHPSQSYIVKSSANIFDAYFDLNLLPNNISMNDNLTLEIDSILVTIIGHLQK